MNYLYDNYGIFYYLINLKNKSKNIVIIHPDYQEQKIDN